MCGWVGSQSFSLWKPRLTQWLNFTLSFIHHAWHSYYTSCIHFLSLPLQTNIVSLLASQTSISPPSPSVSTENQVYLAQKTKQAPTTQSIHLPASMPILPSTFSCYCAWTVYAPALTPCSLDPVPTHLLKYIALAILPSLSPPAMSSSLLDHTHWKTNILQHLPT